MARRRSKSPSLRLISPRSPSNRSSTPSSTSGSRKPSTSATFSTGTRKRRRRLSLRPPRRVKPNDNPTQNSATPSSPGQGPQPLLKPDDARAPKALTTLTIGQRCDCLSRRLCRLGQRYHLEAARLMGRLEREIERTEKRLERAADE